MAQCFNKGKSSGMRIKSLAIDFHFSVCNDSMLYGFRLRLRADDK